MLQTGRLQLFEFDGPIDDPLYHIPGEIRIDTGPNSPEFYQFRQKPVSTIQECARGKRVPCISDWLNEQDARRISPVGIDPQQGFGQNSYNSVQIANDAVRNRDARAFAALREALRAFGLTGTAKTDVIYSDQVRVSNPQLFDMCFLVDGEGVHLSLATEMPINGVCAAATDFILSCVRNCDDFGGNASNWISQDVNPRDAFQRFSGFGIHSFIFPKEDVIRALSLRFAVEFYHKLLTVPPEKVSEGFNKACEILRCTPLTELVVSYHQQNPVHLEPPIAEPRTARANFEILRNRYNIHGTRDHFPSLDLDPIVRIDGPFTSISDEDVREQCRRAIDRIMGDQNSTDPRTVHGWLNTKNRAILNEFAEKLLTTIVELFYDTATEPPKPRPLSDEPYRLALLNDILNYLVSRDKEKPGMVEKFKAEVERLRGRYIDSPTNVIVQQQARVQEIERQMRQSGKRINRHLQERYRQEAEILLELLAWRETTLHLVQLLGQIEGLVDYHRENIGASAYSWMQLFQTYRNTLAGQLENLMREREAREKVPVRHYFPKAGDKAEEQLYHDRAVQTNLHNTLLSQMHWEVVVQTSIAEPTPFDRAMAAELILVVPNVPGFDRTKYGEQVRILRNLADGSIKAKRLSSHAAEEIVLWARQNIQPYFDGDATNPTPFTIWDALWYDFNARWLPERPGQELNGYVRDRVDLLIERSNTLLGHGAQNPPPKDYVRLYAQTQTKEPQAGVLLQAFQKELQNHGIGFTLGASPTECTLVVIEHGVDITSWNYYTTAHGNYREYLNQYYSTTTGQGTNLYPITVCPEEQLAVLIEHHLVNNRTWDRFQLLHPTVIAHFKDHEAFRLFALAYLLDLLDRDTDAPERSEHHFFVPIKNQTGDEVRVKLGRLWEVGEVLRKFLTDEAVRQVVKQRYEQVYQQHRRQPDYPDNLRQLLLKKMSGHHFR